MVTWTGPRTGTSYGQVSAGRPGPRRREEGHIPEPVTVQPLRRGLRLGPLPVSVIVGIELVLCGGLLIAFAGSLWWRYGAGALLALTGLVVMIRVRGSSLGARMAHRAAFRSRSRVLAVPQDRELPERIAPMAYDDEDDLDLPVGEDAVPGHLRTLFQDDLTIVTAFDRPGRAFGAYRHAGRWGAVVRLRAFSEVYGPSGSIALPLRDLCRRLQHCEIPSLTVRIVQASSGRSRTAMSPLLSDLIDELTTDDLTGAPGSHDLLLFLSFDPQVAHRAVQVRGGGETGVARVLAVVLDIVRVICSGRGVEVAVLDGDEVAHTIDRLLMEPVRAVEPVTSWSESWRHVASHKVYHRTFTAVGWRAEADPGALVGVPAHGLVTAVDVLVPTKGNPAIGRITVRATARSEHQLGQTVSEMLSVASRHGLRLRAMDGDQIFGLRATAGVGAL
ncbi:type VII secretion protein EccE [Austwickia sp. TVS 96-490-7B]|uniref:type VII secretion protein EccE n=1 Tax=Austwickia sp. TVS 96-490-7B TaxID=2830843 RepID=UPI001C5622A4|nr:type VII secretion protein EccE [Austwickia sp. TVS 96-490-7B]